MRANYSPSKSLVPPTRFQNPNPNQYIGKNKRSIGRIRFPVSQMKQIHKQSLGVEDFSPGVFDGVMGGKNTIKHF